MRNPSLVFSGEDARLITAGGHSSWHDLTLHLIARLCGNNHALRTAKDYLFSGHLDGQLPFAAMSRRIQKTDAVIGQCQEWIAHNYGCANPVAAMAERSGLIRERSRRRFRAATGYRPMDYVHALRIEEAKQFIESETIGIDEISLKVGYDDPAFFRRLFKRKAGLTPAAYRRKFIEFLAWESSAAATVTTRLWSSYRPHRLRPDDMLVTAVVIPPALGPTAKWQPGPERSAIGGGTGHTTNITKPTRLTHSGPCEQPRDQPAIWSEVRRSGHGDVGCQPAASWAPSTAGGRNTPFQVETGMGVLSRASRSNRSTASSRPGIAEISSRIRSAFAR